MNVEQVLTLLCCALLVGLSAWLLRHTVDRRMHLDGARPISEEVFAARIQGLEDRLGGRIAAINVKLEDMEHFYQHVDRRLEKLFDR